MHALATPDQKQAFDLEAASPNPCHERLLRNSIINAVARMGFRSIKNDNKPYLAEGISCIDHPDLPTFCGVRDINVPAGGGGGEQSPPLLVLV